MQSTEFSDDIRNFNVSDSVGVESFQQVLRSNNGEKEKTMNTTTSLDSSTLKKNSEKQGRLTYAWV
jgi:hypothetical protein